MRAVSRCARGSGSGTDVKAYAAAIRAGPRAEHTSPAWMSQTIKLLPFHRLKTVVSGAEKKAKQQ